MALNFFITGLPRSRTAWFAAYLSAHPDVFCWHEALKGCADPAEFHNKMQPWGVHPAELRIGNSDSGLPLMNHPAMFPDCPSVVIRRNRVDVMHSLLHALDMGSPTQSMIDMLDRCEDRLSEIDGLHVMYDQIDHDMPQIMKWIDVPYREDLHELFGKMNIQTTDMAPDPTALAWLPFAQ